MVEPRRLWELFQAIKPELLRYPSLEPRTFRAAVLAVCAPEAESGAK